MGHSIEITSIDDQTQKDKLKKEKGMSRPVDQPPRRIPNLGPTKKDEVEEGRKVDHLIDINDQYPSGSQTKKSSIKSFTIFKVNMWLRESNLKAYIPKMVSIGPYHKKNSQLHSMKKYKLLYLQRFLQRKEGLDEESCINELEKQKGEAIKCYEDIEDFNTDDFCEMLLLDGCFVVECIREFNGILPQGEDKIIKINAHYILRDLMLLENQLPFFVLDQLHHMTKQDKELSLAKLVSHSFPFCRDLPTMTESFEGTARYNIKHLLDVVHIRLCQVNPKKKSENIDDPKWHMVLPNATELSEAGVSFAKVSDATSLFSIKFENGLMTIP